MERGVLVREGRERATSQLIPEGRPSCGVLSSPLLRPLSSPSVSPWYSIYSKSQQRARFRLKQFGSRPFLRQGGVAMRKTPLALNTSDLWKLNDLTDALYVIVDCHLRAKIKPSG